MPILESPIKLRLSNEDAARVAEELTYEDKRVTYEWLKWRKIQQQDDAWLTSDMTKPRHWYFTRGSREDLDQKVKELAKEKKKSLLFKDEKGYWTYSGFATRIFGKTTINHRYELPKWGFIPWQEKPKYDARYYQTDSLNLLAPEDLSRAHGAVEIGTGLGKTFIMALVLQRIGLPAVITVPRDSIAQQMLADMTRWFGRARVGQFFGGKKDSSKLFTIAISNSLLNVEPGDPHYENIKNKKVLIVDESHLFAADCLSELALKLFDQVPYRYFFSGTQIRSDGLELLLEGIIGDVVYEMSVEQGIEQKFLTPLKFFQYQINSSDKRQPDDAIKMNQIHLHQNKAVYRHAAGLINYSVEKRNRRVLVLVDTVDQYKRLLDGGLKMPSKFAHGPLTAKNRDTVPQDQWKLEPRDLVLAFDNGEFPVLVGTGTISIGTDILSASLLINLVGLTSEIEIRQGVGRLTRLHNSKVDAVCVDYDIENIDKMHKHALKRKRIYDNIYGKCQVLKVKA